MSSVYPPFLKRGDLVGVVAPAGKINYSDIRQGLKVLREDWGLEVREGATLRSGYHQFAATDEERLADLQQMLDSPDVKAVIAARGGYGCSRIVDRLRFDSFIRNPKWLVGFSDLTVLSAHLQNLGYASVHGPMVRQFGTAGGEAALESLRRALFGEALSYHIPSHPFNRPGDAEGETAGGNLCLLAHLIGSSSETDTTGKILFIEDVNEYLYNIDRMMVQLGRAGKLGKLAGLVVGQFSESKDYETPFGKSAFEIIREHTAAYAYPVAYDFPAGHVPDNRALPVGVPARLQVTSHDARLDFPGFPSRYARSGTLL